MNDSLAFINFGMGAFVSLTLPKGDTDAAAFSHHVLGLYLAETGAIEIPLVGTFNVVAALGGRFLNVE